MIRQVDTAKTRQRLMWRIHRRYATTTQEVRLGDLCLDFTRIADPDRVLDEVADEADRRERVTGRRENDEHLHLPYWAELWDSAMGIAQFLAVGNEDAETRRRGDAETKTGAGKPCDSSFPASPRLRVSASSLSVLDLGCGMGLSGTVAAALGARVLFADIEPPALAFAQLNSLPWTDRVRTRRLDWRADRLDETFDLILGADILYERTQWEFLEPFWRAHLAPAGRVLLGEPGRQTGDVFMDWIRARDWRLDLIEEKVPTRPRPIRLFELRPQT